MRRAPRTNGFARVLRNVVVSIIFVNFSRNAGRRAKATTPEQTVSIGAPLSECYVLVTSLSAWEQYVTKEYHDWMLGLVRSHGWKEAKPELFEQLQIHEETVTNELRQICDGRPPSFILFVEMYGLIQTRAMDVLKFLRSNGAVKLGFWMNDVQVPALREMGLSGRARFFKAFDIVFGPYTYLLPVFYPSLRIDNAVWLPNAVAMEMQNVTFQDRPEYHRIFVPGAVDQLWYPVRTWAVQHASRDGSVFVGLSHPGYSVHARVSFEKIDLANAVERGMIMGNVQGAEYALLSGRFVACLTDLQRISAVVSKHFELPATGCLLLTSNQHAGILHALGFKDRVNCILYDKYDPETTIKWVLDPANEHQVNQIRRAGYDFIRSNHLIQHRVNYVAEVSKRTVHGDKRRDAFSPPEMSRLNSCPCPFIGETACECFENWKLVIQSTQSGGESLLEKEISSNFKQCT